MVSGRAATRRRAFGSVATLTFLTRSCDQEWGRSPRTAVGVLRTTAHHDSITLSTSRPTPDLAHAREALPIPHLWNIYSNRRAI